MIKKAKIVVVGSSNTDMIIKVDRIPTPGETIIGGEFSIAAGGKGANQAVAAARAGGEVNFVACVGEDMFGEQAVEGFVKDGINIDYVLKTQDYASGVALIFVDQKGENSIGVASGANSQLMPIHIEQAKNSITSADILVMQLETPIETVNTAAKLASENNVKVILNPAPAQTLKDETFKHISILTPNETETELLTGIKVEDENSASEAADALLSRGIETILITLGPRGVFLASSEIREIVPSFEVKAVDTTAAGDVFNGALAVSLAENKPLFDAVRFANAAAALSVTKLGAQPSAPNREEIDRLLKSND
jgi:ribokinase